MYWRTGVPGLAPSLLPRPGAVAITVTTTALAGECRVVWCGATRASRQPGFGCGSSFSLGGVGAGGFAATAWGLGPAHGPAVRPRGYDGLRCSRCSQERTHRVIPDFGLFPKHTIHTGLLRNNTPAVGGSTPLARPAPAASANALLRLRADRRATRCTVAAVQAPNPRERRCSAPQGATVGVLAPPLLCRREPLLCRWSRTRV